MNHNLYMFSPSVWGPVYWPSPPGTADRGGGNGAGRALSVCVTAVSPGPGIRFVLNKCELLMAACMAESSVLATGDTGLSHLPLQPVWRHTPPCGFLLLYIPSSSPSTHLLCLPEVQAEGPPSEGLGLLGSKGEAESGLFPLSPPQPRIRRPS